MDVASQGIKIQFGDKTFKDLFNIREPDPTDTAWIAEKNRLLATGLTEAQIAIQKPLGRDQRTFTKNVNIAESGRKVEQTLTDKLNTIQASLTQGRLETKQDIDAVQATIMQLLGNVANIQNFTQAELIKVKQVIDRLKLPKTLAEAGFDHRLFDKAEYLRNQGPINAYMISKTSIANLQTPIAVIRGGRPDARWTLSTLYSNWPVGNSAQAYDDPNLPSLYLDLEHNSIIEQAAAIRLVQTGVDNGILSGQPVQVNINLGGPQPPPPPPPPAPLGARIGDVVPVGPQRPPQRTFTNDEVNTMINPQLINYGRVLARYHNFTNLREYVKQKYGFDDARTDTLLTDIPLTRAEVVSLNYAEP